MAPARRLQDHRDQLVLVLLGLALLITFLADAAGWFRAGAFPGR
jgi:hypothetical protein